MVLRTEIVQQADATILRLIGQITWPEVQRLKLQIEEAGPLVVLDLGQVDLADLDAARFLAAAELSGIELRQVPRYLREWISLEKPRVGAEEVPTFTNSKQ